MRPRIVATDESEANEWDFDSVGIPAHYHYNPATDRHTSEDATVGDDLVEIHSRTLATITRVYTCTVCGATCTTEEDCLPEELDR